MDEKSASNASLADLLYSCLDQQEKPGGKQEKKGAISSYNRNDNKAQSFSNEPEVSFERYSTNLTSNDQNTYEPKDSADLSHIFNSALEIEKKVDNKGNCEKKSSIYEDRKELESDSNFELTTNDRFSSRQRYYGDREIQYTTSSLHSYRDSAVNLDNIKYFKQNIEPVNYSTGAIKKRTNVVKERKNEQKNIGISSVKGETIGSCSNTGKESNSLEPSDSEEANYKSNVNVNVDDNISQFFFLKYDHLEELVKGDTSDLVLMLTSPGFKNCLKETLSPNWIILLVNAFRKVSETDCKEKSNILSYASEMCFLEQISEYLKKLPFENDPTRQSNIENFLENLLVFLEALLILLPRKACDALENILNTMRRSITCVEKSGSITLSEENKEKLVNLMSRLEVRMSEYQKVYKANNSTNNMENGIPPSYFRMISVYPNDFLSSEKPFIRPNIVKGPYDSVEHYLDVQFRLLHEDFLSPLREAVAEYVSNIKVGNTRKKINNVRFYHPVYFVSPVMVKDKVALLVCFNKKAYWREFLNWQTNKLFMFGSLLCFSRDHFATAFFGTVIDSNIEDLTIGYITVMLNDAAHTIDGLFSLPFTLAESEIHFEPYHHTLNALQRMPDYNFPMKRYIVDVECTSAPPKYVTDLPHVEYHIGDHKVRILDDSTWPSAESLNLDESQYNAFKSALTKEFVLIQGPSGTGKTFLAVKIVNTLLDVLQDFRSCKLTPLNIHKIWDVKHPILFICNTNHALDQFLENILPYTDKITRVGGQSKNKVLSSYNLKERLNNMLKLLSYWKGVNHRICYSSLYDYLCDLKEIYHTRYLACKDLYFLEDTEFAKSQNRLPYENLNNPESFDRLKQLDSLQWELHQCRQNISMALGGIKRVRLRLASIRNHEGVVPLDLLSVGENHKNCFKNHEGYFSDSLFIEWLEKGLEEYKEHAVNNDNMDLQCMINCPVNDTDGDINNDVRVDKDLWKFALDLHSLKRNIGKIRLQLTELRKKNKENPEPTVKEIELACQLKELNVTLQYWETNLSHGHKLHPAVIQRILSHQNLWELQATERWILYQYWLKEYLDKEMRTLRLNLRSADPHLEQYEMLKQQRDYLMMKNSHVIGMTITGAVRIQTLLDKFQPKIVIVEEAEQVMESHIVVSLTRHCEHVILFGNHQQFRPNIGTYKLTRDYHSGVSLFERMVNNGMHCEVLKVQHGMRPLFR